MMKVLTSVLVLVIAATLFCPSVICAQEFLIWDADINHNSGDLLKTALELNGYIGDIQYDSTLTPYLGTLDDYCAIFICLGSFPFKYKLKDGEDVDSLISYLDRGGNIYMEGGDTWFLDEQTDLHPYFKIDAWHNGYYGTYIISGQLWQFTEGMIFNYKREDYYRLDRLDPELGAVAIFQNGPDSIFYNGIAYDAGTYKTVGMSFEFGGLEDAVFPSTKVGLAFRMMDGFFGCVLPGLYQDVALLSIDNPDWWACPNADVIPKVTVKGFGDSVAVNFGVTFEVLDSSGFSVYSEVVNIASLEKDSVQQVTFPSWTVGGKGNDYQITAYAQLPGDERPENDTISSTTTTSMPFGAVLERNTYQSVGALGGITYCELDGYFYFVSKENDQVYRLNPEDMDDYSLAFATANADDETPYGISWDGRYFWIGHMEESALNYFYNRQYTYVGSPTGFYVDMAGVAGQWWAGMDYDGKYTRQVTVGANNAIYRLDLYQTWGTLAQDFITGTWSDVANRGCGYLPYTNQILTGRFDRDTLYAINATSGLIDDRAKLKDLLLGVAGVDFYDLGSCNQGCAQAMVTIADLTSTILKVGLDLTQAVNDFAAISIDSPGDSIPQDSTVIVGTVANWGTQDQDSVLIRCSATHEDSGGPEFTDSTWTSLVPSCQQEQVIFPNLWLPSAAGCYRMMITTNLATDENYYNDTKEKKVCVTAGPTIHDGAVVAINAPPDTVDFDSTYTPKAIVQNLGNTIETFDVECTISPGYVDTQQVVLLGSGQPQQVNFTDWTVTDSITYIMCVRTFVTDDNNPANDSLCKSIFAWGLTAAEEELAHHQLPKAFGLSVSRPNPFTTATTISYAVADARHTTLRIYDLTGRVVRTLVEEAREPGYYEVVWDGRDDAGNRVPAGVYFYRLEARAEDGKRSASFSASKKMVILR
ncbi:hypothetical protein E3J38_01495 [candidate division TA06 bacterium]|uniref:FlgD/Vpr Ig-like domain-containing protein n=1 Tax=candidate division TA06 bacterium TaxID=2250710 RepID=A0A523XU71_UNCT6|nr:MAG: hypothetical protein E3J38_01495 [candidate division TA06 bacterium]